MTPTGDFILRLDAEPYILWLRGQRKCLPNYSAIFPLEIAIQFDTLRFADPNFIKLTSFHDRGWETFLKTATAVQI
jgi:hypothetical protein